MLLSLEENVVAVVVLGFYVPPTTKVIQRRDLGLKSHPKDFIRGDKFFRTFSRRKIRTNDLTSKHQLLHFMTSKKVKPDIFVQVIYN